MFAWTLRLKDFSLSHSLVQDTFITPTDQGCSPSWIFDGCLFVQKCIFLSVTQVLQGYSDLILVSVVTSSFWMSTNIVYKCGPHWNLIYRLIKNPKIKTCKLSFHDTTSMMILEWKLRISITDPETFPWKLLKFNFRVKGINILLRYYHRYNILVRLLIYSIYMWSNVSRPISHEWDNS